MYFEFSLGELLNAAQERGVKKFMIIVDENSGFKLTHVDVEYYR